MLLGFSSGYFKKEADLFARLDYYLSLGCSAVELNLSVEELYLLQDFIKLKDYLAGFKYFSVHGPAGKFRYSSTGRSKEIMDLLAKVVELTHPTCVVIHCDVVDDVKVIKSYGWPIALENMDKNKSNGKTAAEIEDWFRLLPKAKMVLDLNHIFTNDPDMILASKMWNKFKDRIVHFHLSGYIDESRIHAPLSYPFSNSDKIVPSLPTSSLPIILEPYVALMSNDELKQEYEFILNHNTA